MPCFVLYVIEKEAGKGKSILSPGRICPRGRFFLEEKESWKQCFWLGQKEAGGGGIGMNKIVEKKGESSLGCAPGADFCSLFFLLLTVNLQLGQQRVFCLNKGISLSLFSFIVCLLCFWFACSVSGIVFAECHILCEI